MLGAEERKRDRVRLLIPTGALANLDFAIRHESIRTLSLLPHTRPVSGSFQVQVASFML